jgi:hypothetical protein
VLPSLHLALRMDALTKVAPQKPRLARRTDVQARYVRSMPRLAPQKDVWAMLVDLILFPALWMGK